MTTLTQFKTKHSFTEVAGRFGYHFSPNKTNICPCCNKNTFSVFNNDTRYKCFRPACDLNKVGDIFNFLQILGISSSFKESISLLNLETSNTVKQNKVSILDTVFDLYKEQYTNSVKAQEYLIHRGYSTKKIEVGYAPADVYFLRDRLEPQLEVLKSYSLVNDNYEDYFKDRLIFPVRDLSNKIVHFHSRDISNDPNITLRWLASKRRDTSNINYLWRGHIEKNSKALFLTEGISDGLSLVNWDLPTVSTMSIQADFTTLLQPFTNLEELHCIFDNDRHSISTNKSSYTYKSWEVVLPKLISLKLARPNLTIYCLMPPSLPNVKDLNDFTLTVSKKEFQDYYSKNTLSLPEFTFKFFFRPDYYKSLIQLSKDNLTLQQKLLSVIDNEYNNWLEFIYKIL